MLDSMNKANTTFNMRIDAAYKSFIKAATEQYETIKKAEEDPTCILKDLFNNRHQRYYNELTNVLNKGKVRCHEFQGYLVDLLRPQFENDSITMEYNKSQYPSDFLLRYDGLPLFSFNIYNHTFEDKRENKTESDLMKFRSTIEGINFCIKEKKQKIADVQGYMTNPMQYTKDSLTKREIKDGIYSLLFRKKVRKFFERGKEILEDELEYLEKEYKRFEKLEQEAMQTYHGYKDLLEDKYRDLEEFFQELGYTKET